MTELKSQQGLHGPDEMASSVNHLTASEDGTSNYINLSGSLQDTSMADLVAHDFCAIEDAARRSGDLNVKKLKILGKGAFGVVWEGV